MRVADQLNQLRRFVERSDFAGWDPYDAMNSPLLRWMSLGTRCGRIAWTQFMRRFPINLRPLLLVPKQHNPKGLGLFLQGYAKIYSVSGDQTLQPLIDRLLTLLKEHRSSGWSGNSWGYNFDWQSRVAFVPKFTPTIVNSAFIGHALLDCHELTGDQTALELVSTIPDFILGDLNRKQEGDTFCFSYTPVDHNYVHNANMMGASLLLRMGKVAGRQTLIDSAYASLAYSMKYQNDDGSWFYAETDQQRWIDSFHTGFNLEALRWFIRLGEGASFLDGYGRGVNFYANNFFLDDGTPKYYHDKIYPIDIHAPTEAICFFSSEAGHEDLAERIMKWTLDNMWDDQRGFFYFRKTPVSVNRIPYLRWAEAWGFRALAEFHFHRIAEHA